jgi:hypothetical protein
MQNPNDISPKTLMPVFHVSGCVGHILRTARGFRACDANDKEIGVFETAGLSIVALLGAATDAACSSTDRAAARSNDFTATLYRDKFGPMFGLGSSCSPNSMLRASSSQRFSNWRKS